MELFTAAANASYVSATNETIATWTTVNHSWTSNVTATGTSDVPVYHSLGPSRDPLYIVIPITIVYLLILFTGTIGNVSTCIVIARNKSMHTATNYYLFSLAVSDLLLLMFGLPVEVYLVWFKYSYVFGEIFCMLRGMAAECSTNASVLTITAFTVERYVAICHPFLSHTMSKLSRAIKLILVIWVVALCFAIPMALQFGVVRHDQYQDVSICTLKTTLYEHSFEIATLLFFVVPMILITVLYVMIGLKLRQSNMMKRDNGRGRSVRNTASNGGTTAATAAGGGSGGGGRKERNCRHHTGRSSRRVLKMLVAVVVAFFICWAPFHVQRLIYIYGTLDDHVSSKNKWMEFLFILATYISGVLYYVSATINPILYNIMSNKFREAFMETLGRTCGRSSFSVQQEQRSYSSLSRSQQRGNGGYFGSSRAAGTFGTVVAQDSTDCSNNSVRDEGHLKRSPSVVEQSVVRNNSVERGKLVPGAHHSTGRCTLNGIERHSSVSRKISINEDPRICSEVDVSLLDGSSNRLTVYPGQNPDRSPGERAAGRTRRWHEGSYRVSRNNRVNASPANRSSTGNNNHHNRHNENNNHNNNQFGLGTIDGSAVRRKKWWRLFKWLPEAKVFKFANGRGRYSRSSGEPVVNGGIESNREEYSMTMCGNVRNAGDQRPV